MTVIALLYLNLTNMMHIPWAPSADLLIEEVEKFLAQFARGLDNTILKDFLKQQLTCIRSKCLKGKFICRKMPTRKLVIRKKDISTFGSHILFPPIFIKVEGILDTIRLPQQK